MRVTREAGGGAARRTALTAAALAVGIAGLLGGAPVATADDGYPTNEGPFGTERACQRARDGADSRYARVSPCLHDTDGWYFGHR